MRAGVALIVSKSTVAACSCANAAMVNQSADNCHRSLAGRAFATFSRSSDATASIRAASQAYMAALNVALSALLLACLMPAQQTTIRTNVPLVSLPVSVTDARGRFVYGLTASDFVLRDNGQLRSIRVDDPDSVTAPIEFVVLIQTSDISDSALLKIKKIGTMIQDAVVGANGEAAVVTFADQVKTLQKFTRNDDELDHAFQDLRSAKSRDGRLLDAVAAGLDLLETRPANGRSILLIIGEGKDRGSETKLSALLPRIQQSKVTIYSLGYSAYLTPFTTKGGDYTPPAGGSGWIGDAISEALHSAKQDTSRILTAATGGRQLKFETKAKLENDLIRLGSDIHNRYMVSFSPPDESAADFHKLAVEITGRPDLHVEARPGYWTMKSSPPDPVVK